MPMVEQTEIILPPFERGFHMITDLILDQLARLPEKGFLNLFIKHTSAGITINENADPSVVSDLEKTFNKLVPDSLREYIHTMEGPDDMPAHVKSSLVGHSVTVPITNHRLNLGTWQGIFLCEFRNRGGKRKLLATIYS
jgi:secondary thiamine-phosphate synthase enzyme